ncbi:MAG: CvpA family protein [Clostridia bacterium]|nr:CvpA family protein [Clostridia bacterium]
MYWIFDIVMVAVLALSIFIGYKRGLIMTAFSLASVIIAVVLAQMLNPIVYNAVAATEIDEKIEQKVTAYIEDVYEEKAVPVLEQKREDIIKEAGLPSFLEKIIIESDSAALKTAENEMKKVSVAAAEFTMKLLCFVLVAVIIVILLTLLMFALKIVSKLPVIKTFNAGGGAIAGAVIGLGIVYIVCVAVYAFSFALGGSVQGVADTSLIIGGLEKAGIISMLL